MKESYSLRFDLTLNFIPGWCCFERAVIEFELLLDFCADICDADIVLFRSKPHISNNRFDRIIDSCLGGRHGGIEVFADGLQMQNQSCVVVFRKAESRANA